MSHSYVVQPKTKCCTLMWYPLYFQHWTPINILNGKKPETSTEKPSEPKVRLLETKKSKKKVAFTTISSSWYSSSFISILARHCHYQTSKKHSIYKLVDPRYLIDFYLDGLFDLVRSKWATKNFHVMSFFVPRFLVILMRWVIIMSNISRPWHVTFR